VSDDDSSHRTSRNPLSRITNAAAGAIDVNALVESVDVDALVDRLDLDELLARVDLNAALDRVDPDQLLDRVDPNRLLDRVDPDRLLDRVDPDRLLDRVDPNRLMDRVDVDRFMDRVDVKALVDRAGVADIVGESTGQVAGSVLDAGRRQVVAIDEIAGRIGYRVVRRDPVTTPEGPSRLIAPLTDKKGRGVVTGHYAGPVARSLAFLADIACVFGIYTVVTAGLAFFVTVILQIDPPDIALAPVLGVLALATWAFSYSLIGIVVAGRTLGKALIGLRVVTADGAPPTPGQAIVRAMATPLSFVFLGLGLLGIAFGAKRTGWHDKLSGTAVVLDWGDRPAALPAPLTHWLAEKSADEWTDKLVPKREK